MAKNYANLYASTNDAVSVVQRVYVKQEASKGTLIAPQNTDFIYTLQGGTVDYAQPKETSPHRSGRHHKNFIKKKKTTSWSLPTYFNIDQTLGSASTSEIDVGIRMLYKSLFGREQTSPNLIYDTLTAPDITFSLFEVGDKWARQVRAAFVQTGNFKFPGDGEATIEWGGNAADAVVCGIAKSVLDNDGGNTVTVATGEGKRIPVGSLVMLIEADGTTRSADTAAGTARLVTSVSGDIVTLGGSALADADGSSTPLYLSYYEPAAPAAIDNPVTGLVGTAVLTGWTSGFPCFRTVEINCNNNHELVDYCYGKDALDTPYFVPADRFTIDVSVELNLNDKLVEFFNTVQAFTAQELTVVLGAASGRRAQFVLPKIVFDVPSYSVPDTGSIPVTFKGMPEETGEDTADELTVQFL